MLTTEPPTAIIATRPNAPTPSRSLLRRVLASPIVDRLTAPYGIDRYLELVDPRWAVHRTRAEVVAVDRQTRGTVTLTLRPNDAWTGFQAGQHVDVGVDIGGTIHQRSFSLAGSPNHPDGLLELTIKANPTGRVSRHLVDRARPGMVLRLSEAKGDFVLPAIEQRTRPLVLISGGSGITPVLSMLRALVDDGHTGPVTFVHYALSEADVCYPQELRRLVDALPEGRLLFGFPDEAAVDADAAGRLPGFFGTDHLAAITDDPSGIDVYLCGPTPLMAAVEQHFAELGLSDRIHLERFGAPPLDPDLDLGNGTVAFNRSLLTVAAEGTLLDTAEAAGLNPAFGCRRGICGTCTTTKTSGRVRNTVTGQESAGDTEPVRLCVSVACGDVTLDL